jgi:hypothetical protein
MKNVPTRETGEALDISAAAAAARKAMEATARQVETRPEHEGNKYVNLRFKESDYMRLGNCSEVTG